VKIDGHVESGFEAVAEAFEHNFSERGEVGAAFAAYLDGVLVVDLWAGTADSPSGRPWRSDTIQPIFSGTKGLVATCLLLLVERGEVELDAPLSRYWPEFAAHGKDGVLVRHVVSHTAGLPGIRRHVLGCEELLDSRQMAALLVDEEPIWPPGSTLAYHPYTYGWLCGELIRRVDGRDLGQFFADDIAAPLDLDLWIGLPVEQDGRVAQLEVAPDYGKGPSTDLAQIYADPVRAAVWGNPPILVRNAFDWNAPGLHRVGVPGVGAVGEARAIARLYGCLARGGEIDGTRLLSQATVAKGARPLARGTDPVSDAPSAHGIGFALQTDALPFGPPHGAFGHSGAGGSLHGAWPTQRVGFSYAPNQRRDDDPDQRSAALLRALFDAVDIP
jgi:CubicO group peptidase (beta-lactamase class C family)